MLHRVTVVSSSIFEINAIVDIFMGRNIIKFSRLTSHTSFSYVSENKIDKLFMEERRRDCAVLENNLTIKR